MVDEKNERLQKLQVFLYGFGMRDRRSVNDAIYIAQNLVSGFPELYTDFKGFAKLGVSSLTLHEDYSILQENAFQLPELPKNEEMERIKIAGKVLSKYPREILELISCSLYYKGNMLLEEEVEKARDFIDNLRRNMIKERLRFIDEKFENDPKVKKEAEEYRRKYGELTAEDLMKKFTI